MPEGESSFKKNKLLWQMVPLVNKYAVSAILSNTVCFCFSFEKFQIWQSAPVDHGSVLLTPPNMDSEEVHKASVCHFPLLATH